MKTTQANSVHGDFALGGSVAVVTGAATGIGRAIAAGLTAAGARVVAMDTAYRDDDRATVEDDRSGTELQLAVDVSNEDEVEAAFERVESDVGPVSVVVANAGLGGARSFILDSTVEEWQNHFAVNLLGAFLTFRAGARHMIGREQGSLIGIVSAFGLVADYRGNRSSLSYSATKGGLVNLIRTAAVQLAPFGIRVNGIAPNFTRTGIGGGWMLRVDPSQHPELKEYVARTPLGRLGEPDDYQGPAVFLASDAARYVTGVTLPVDGGYTAW